MAYKSDFKNKISDTSRLVKKTDYKSKIIDVEGKIPCINGFTTNSALKF